MRLMVKASPADARDVRFMVRASPADARDARFAGGLW